MVNYISLFINRNMFTFKGTTIAAKLLPYFMKYRDYLLLPLGPWIYQVTELLKQLFCHKPEVLKLWCLTIKALQNKLSY